VFVFREKKQKSKGHFDLVGISVQGKLRGRDKRMAKALLTAAL